MADNVTELDHGGSSAQAEDLLDRWAEARERLAQYDRDGCSVSLDDALARFDLALEAALASEG